MSDAFVRSRREDTPLRLFTSFGIAARGRVLHQQMHMIILAVARPQFGAEVFAHVGEDGPAASSQRRIVQDAAPVFCHEDQVDVERINY